MGTETGIFKCYLLQSERIHQKSVFNPTGQGNGVKGRQKFRAMTPAGNSVLCWEPKPLGAPPEQGFTQYLPFYLFILPFPLGKLGWKSLKHLWGAQQLGKKRAKRTSQSTRGEVVKRSGGKTHPKSLTCSFPVSRSGSDTPTDACSRDEPLFHLKIPRDFKQKSLLFC